VKSLQEEYEKILGINGKLEITNTGLQNEVEEIKKSNAVKE